MYKSFAFAEENVLRKKAETYCISWDLRIYRLLVTTCFHIGGIIHMGL